MKQRQSPLILPTLAIALLVSACGGGGSGSGGTPPQNTIKITGQAQAGPINGGVFTAFQVNADGTTGAAIAQGVTLNGRLDIVINPNFLSYDGPVLIELVGGTYLDEATQTTRTLGSTLKCVLPSLPASAGTSLPPVRVNITPLTTLAAEMALNSSGGLSAASINAANDSLSRLIGTSFNPLTDELVDPSAQNTGAVSQSVADHTLLVAGFSQLAMELGLSPDQLFEALKQDVLDGKLDGRDRNGQSTLDDSSMVTRLLRATRAFQGSSNNNQNLSLSPALEGFLAAFDGNLSRNTLPGLDTTSPRVMERFPLPGSSNQAINSRVILRFDEELNPNTVSPSSVVVSAAGTPITGGALDYDARSRSITYTPPSDFAQSTVIAVAISDELTDLVGNRLNQPDKFSFTTGTGSQSGATFFSSSAVIPGNGASVPNGQSLVVSFDRPLNLASLVDTASMSLSSGGQAVGFAVTYNLAANSFTVTPAVPLSTGSQTFTLNASLTDAFGNSLGNSFTRNFSVNAGQDNDAPSVSDASPTNGSAHFQADGSLLISFDEAMSASTVFNALSLTQGATPISFSSRYLTRFNQLEVTPVSALTAGLNYTLSISNSAQDLAGNGLNPAFSMTFTVAQTELRITTTQLPSATTNQAYNETILSNGGTAPVSFALINGSLPNGLMLNANGTITGAANASGAATFTVRATDSTSPTAVTDDQVFNLNVNDPVTNPTVQFLNTSTVTLDEAAQSILVPIVLNTPAALTNDITVTVQATGGTATAGTDFNLSAAPLSFPSGSVDGDQINVNLGVVSDTLFENGNETIILEITAAMTSIGMASIGSNSSHTVTITEDDQTPSLSLDPNNNLSLVEGSSGSLGVRLSNASVLPISVPFTVAGTATAADHDLVAGTININAGDTTGSVSFNSTNDMTDEDDESLVVTLSMPNNATLTSPITQSFTIQDDDAFPTVSVSAVTADEGTGAATFDLNLNLAHGRSSTVSVEINSSPGTALAGNDGDFLTLSTTVTFPPGVTTQSATVTLIDDALDENDETFTVTLANPNSLSLGNATATGTITDNDNAPNVSFVTMDQNRLESAGNLQVAIVLDTPSGKDVSVPFSLSGTATTPDDYSLSANSFPSIPATNRTSAPNTVSMITVTIVDDPNMETLFETAILTLDPPTNANLGAMDMLILTIVDNESTPDMTLDVTANGTALAPNPNNMNRLEIAEDSSATLTIRATTNAPFPQAVSADFTVTSTQITRAADNSDLDTQTDLARVYVTQNNASPRVSAFTPFVSGQAFRVENQATVDALNNEGIAIDTLGNLFMAGDVSVGVPSIVKLNNIAVRPDGGVFNQVLGDTLLAGAATELMNPKGIDIDTDRQLIFVAEFGANKILVFGTSDVGNVAPQASIDTSSITGVNGKPWDLDYDSINDRLFVATTAGDVLVFDAFVANLATVNTPNRTFSVGLAGTKESINLHGIVYNAASDELYLSDVGVPGDNTDGLLFIVSGAAAAGAAPASPSAVADRRLRVFTGGNLRLGNPVDIAFDGNNLYVAEKTDGTNTGGVLIFENWAANNGNMSIDPTQSIPLAAGSGTESIALDPGTRRDISLRSTGTITIPANMTEADISFTIDDDNRREGAEVFTVTLSNFVNSQAGANVSRSVEIGDNDAQPNISVSSLSVDEGAGLALLKVTLDELSEETITVTALTTDNSAAAPGDYSSINNTVTLSPGQSTAIVAITINDDALNETTEDFTATLQNSANAALGTNTASITINDNDPLPTVSLVAAPTINESDGTASLSVQLDAPTGQMVSVEVNFASGTATLGTDFSVAVNPSVVTFSPSTPGPTPTQSVTITLNADTLNEANEDFTATLQNPSNAILGTSMITAVINDDDIVNLSLTTNAPIGTGLNESSNITYTITNTGNATASSQFFTISFSTIDLSARSTAPIDFQAINSTTLNFDQNLNDQILQITVNDDLINETDERFRGTLSNLAAGASANGGTNNVRFDGSVNTLEVDSQINDNDPMTIELVQTGGNVTEANAGITTATFQINVSGSTQQPFRLQFNVDSSMVAGDPTEAADLNTTGLPRTLIDPVNGTSLSVAVLGDSVNEADEQFEGVLSNLSGSINGISISTPRALVIIEDNDDISFDLSSVNTPLTEPTSASANFDFTVMNSIATTNGTEQTINLSFEVDTSNIMAPNNPIEPAMDLNFPGPTAVSLNTSTLTATVSVPANADTINEANEQFEGLLTLTNAPRGVSLGTTRQLAQLDDVDDISIVVNPQAGLSLGESNNAAAAPSTLTLMYSNSTATTQSTEQMILLRFAPTGLAANNADYMLSPSGQTTALTEFALSSTLTPIAIDMRALDDGLNEGPQDFSLDLTLVGMARGVGLGAVSAQGVLEDSQNDQVTLTLAPSNALVGEGGNIEYTIIATGAARTEQSITLELTAGAAGDTATAPGQAGADYNISPGTTFTFTGVLEGQSFTLIAPDDAVADDDEVYTLNFSSSNANVAVSTTTLTGSIDEDPIASVSTGSNTATENGTPQTSFIVSLSRPAPSALTIDFQLTGTATNGSDYNNVIPTVSGNPLTGTVSFGMGQSTATISLDLIDDADIEGNERLTVTLTNPTGGVILGSNSTASQTIIDDELSVTLGAPTPVSESEANATAISFPINLSGPVPAGQSLTVPFELTGSATNNADYTVTTPTSGATGQPARAEITLNAGESTANVVVTVNNDTLVEGAETITLTLVGTSNGQLGAGLSQTHTITDDDGQSVILSQVSPPTASEASATTVSFQVQLSQSSAAATDVTFTVSGSATAGAGNDYLQNTPAPGVNTITVPAGMTTANITVDVLNDATPETTEAITVTLTGANNGFVLGTTSTQSHLILDDDLTISLSVTPLRAQESAASTVTFTVSASSNVPADVIVPFTLSGSAGFGDFNNLSPSVSNGRGFVTISSGNSSASITLEVVADSNSEPAKTIVVSLGEPGHAVLGSPAVATHIIDEDLAPVGNDDNFTGAIGNTLYEVTNSAPTAGQRVNQVVVAGNVLDNDTDANIGDVLIAVSPVLISPTPTGNPQVDARINLNTDGSFLLEPPVGFTGTVQFTYEVQDNGGLTDTATVNVTVNNDRVWYVDNSFTGVSDGRSTTPFTSISAALAVSNATDIVYVLETGAGDYQTTGLTLSNSQTIIGNGVPLNIQSGQPLSLNTIVNQGTPPRIRNSSGNALTLATDNTLRGLNIQASGNALQANTNFGTLTISEVGLSSESTQGTPLSLTADGTLQVNISTYQKTGIGAGLIVEGDLSGNLTIQGGGINAASSNALRIRDTLETSLTTINLTFTDIQNSSPPDEGVFLRGIGGHFTVTGNATLEGNSDSALHFIGTAADFTANFMGTTTLVNNHGAARAATIQNFQGNTNIENFTFNTLNASNSGIGALIFIDDVNNVTITNGGVLSATGSGTALRANDSIVEINNVTINNNTGSGIQTQDATLIGAGNTINTTRGRAIQTFSTNYAIEFDSITVDQMSTGITPTAFTLAGSNGTFVINGDLTIQNTGTNDFDFKSNNNATGRSYNFSLSILGTTNISNGIGGPGIYLRGDGSNIDSYNFNQLNIQSTTTALTFDNLNNSGNAAVTIGAGSSISSTAGDAIVLTGGQNNRIDIDTSQATNVTAAANAIVNSASTINLTGNANLTISGGSSPGSHGLSLNTASITTISTTGLISITGNPPVHVTDSGTQATITGAVNISSSGSEPGVEVSSGTITLNNSSANSTITGSSAAGLSATTGGSIQINSPNADVNVTGATSALSATGTSSNISFTGSGTLTANANTIASDDGATISVHNPTGAAALNIVATNGPAINLGQTAAATFNSTFNAGQSVTVSATGGPAILSANNSTLNSNFRGGFTANLNNTGSTGLDLDNTGGSLNVQGSIDISNTTAGGNAIDINNTGQGFSLTASFVINNNINGAGISLTDSLTNNADALMFAGNSTITALGGPALMTTNWETITNNFNGTTLSATNGPAMSITNTSNLSFFANSLTADLDNNGASGLSLNNVAGTLTVNNNLTLRNTTAGGYAFNVNNSSQSFTANLLGLTTISTGIAGGGINLQGSSGTDSFTFNQVNINATGDPALNVNGLQNTGGPAVTIGGSAGTSTIATSSGDAIAIQGNLNTRVDVVGSAPVNISGPDGVFTLGTVFNLNVTGGATITGTNGIGVDTRFDAVTTINGNGSNVDISGSSFGAIVRVFSGTFNYTGPGTIQGDLIGIQSEGDACVANINAGNTGTTTIVSNVAGSIAALSALRGTINVNGTNGNAIAVNGDIRAIPSANSAILNITGNTTVTGRANARRTGAVLSFTGDATGPVSITNNNGEAVLIEDSGSVSATGTNGAVSITGNTDGVLMDSGSFMATDNVTITGTANDAIDISNGASATLNGSNSMVSVSGNTGILISGGGSTFTSNGSVSITGTGALAINSTGGTSTLDGLGQTLNLTGQSGAISVTGGSVSVTGPGTISATTGNALAVDNGAALSVTAGSNGDTNVTASAGNAAMVGANASSTLLAAANSGNSVNLNATSGTAITSQNGSSITATFGTITADAGGAAHAMHLLDVNGSITVTGTTTVSNVNAAGAAISVDNSSNNRSFTLNLSGNLTATSNIAGTGIQIFGTGAGTDSYTFTNPSISSSNDALIAGDLNGTVTVNVTTAVTIDSANNIGASVLGLGGSAGNTSLVVNATSGAALNIQGGSTALFASDGNSVSINGQVNIVGTVIDGIDAQSGASVSLNSMGATLSISAALGNAIKSNGAGSNVTGTGVNVSSNIGSGADAIRVTSSGTVTINNDSTITGDNNGVTVNNATFNANDFVSITANGVGVDVQSGGTANLLGNSSNLSVVGNTNALAARGGSSSLNYTASGTLSANGPLAFATSGGSINLTPSNASNLTLSNSNNPAVSSTSGTITFNSNGANRVVLSTFSAPAISAMAGATVNGTLASVTVDGNNSATSGLLFNDSSGSLSVSGLTSILNTAAGGFAIQVDNSSTDRSLSLNFNGGTTINSNIAGGALSFTGTGSGTDNYIFVDANISSAGIALQANNLNNAAGTTIGIFGSNNPASLSSTGADAVSIGTGTNTTVSLNGTGNAVNISGRNGVNASGGSLFTQGNVSLTGNTGAGLNISSGAMATFTGLGNSTTLSGPSALIAADAGTMVTLNGPATATSSSNEALDINSGATVTANAMLGTITITGNTDGVTLNGGSFNGTHAVMITGSDDGIDAQGGGNISLNGMTVGFSLMGANNGLRANGAGAVTITAPGTVQGTNATTGVGLSATNTTSVILNASATSSLQLTGSGSHALEADNSGLSANSNGSNTVNLTAPNTGGLSLRNGSSVNASFGAITATNVEINGLAASSNLSLGTTTITNSTATLGLLIQSPGANTSLSFGTADGTPDLTVNDSNTASLPAIRLTGIEAGANVNLNDVTMTARAERGLEISTNSGAVNIGQYDDANASNANGDGIFVQNSAGNLTIATANISNTIRNLIRPSLLGPVSGNSGDGNAIQLDGASGTTTINGGLIENLDADGIFAHNGTANLSLSNLTINNPGDPAASNDGNGLSLIGLTGDITLSNLNLRNVNGTATKDTVFIYNNNVNLNAITCTNVNINATAGDTGGDEGFEIIFEGSTTANSVTFSGGTIRRIGQGAIALNLSDTSSLTTLNIDGLSFENTGSTGLNNISIVTADTARIANLNIGTNTANTFTDVTNGILRGSIDIDYGGNSMTAINLANNTVSSANGLGIEVDFLSGSGNLTIQNNTIDRVASDGIQVEVNKPTGTLNIRIEDNNVGSNTAVGTASSGEALELRFFSGNGVVQTSNCLVANNTFINNRSNQEAVDIDVETNHTVNLTMTGNTISNLNAGGNSLRITTERVSSTLCLDLNDDGGATGRNNVQLGGAGSGSGNILLEGTQGTFTYEATGTAATTAGNVQANNDATTVTITGTVNNNNGSECPEP